jgi:hypothetical protein
MSSGVARHKLLRLRDFVVDALDPRATFAAGIQIYAGPILILTIFSGFIGFDFLLQPAFFA